MMTDGIRDAAAPAGVTYGPWEHVAEEFAAWRDDGDREALDRLVRRLTPVLWQIVRACGVDRSQAEDVVQSTWFTVIDKAGTVRDPKAAGRWITTVARRRAWKVARAGRAEAPADMEAMAERVGPAHDPAVAVLLDDDARRLWTHVGALPERCRRLLRFLAFDDRPDYASISEQMDIPVGSIGPTRGRCLDKLRRLLAGDPEWSDR